MLCNNLHGKEIQKRRTVCIRIADSFCCSADTNTTLQSDYTTVKNNNNFLKVSHPLKVVKEDSKEYMVAQTVKRLPTMRKTRVWSLGWEYPLEKETATHSSTLAWKIPWTEDPSRLQSMGSQRVGHNWATSLSLSYYSKKNNDNF